MQEDNVQQNSVSVGEPPQTETNVASTVPVPEHGQPSKKRSKSVTAVGIIFILLGSFVLLVSAYRIYVLYFKEGYLEFPILAGSIIVGLLMSIVLIFCGIGIVKRRFGARYIAIATATLTLSGQPNGVLLLGTQNFDIVDSVIQVLWFVFIIWFFNKRFVKQELNPEGKRFTVKSGYGVVVILIAFMIVTPPLIVAGAKIAVHKVFNEPFFLPEPSRVTVPIVVTQNVTGYRPVELFNMSLIIPDDFLLISVTKPTDDLFGWSAMVGVPNKTKEKGLIALNSKNEELSLLADFFGYKQDELYQFERTVLTSNSLFLWF